MADLTEPDPCGRGLATCRDQCPPWIQDTTNKSALTGVGAPLVRASPTSEGHDRLMTSVQRPTNTPLPVCPNCGERVTRDLYNVDALGVVQASYVCPDRHVWLEKWLTSGAA